MSNNVPNFELRPIPPCKFDDVQIRIALYGFYIHYRLRVSRATCRGSEDELQLLTATVGVALASGFELGQVAETKARQKVKDQLFCEDTCQWFRHKSHATRSGHKMRPLRTDEVEAWVARRVGEALGDTATREQHVRADVAELDRQEESAARGPEASLQRVAPMGDPALYTMTFGKYRKRKLTVAQVHAENPGYLTHIVASMGNSISSFPGFRQALMDAGLWLSIVRDTPGVRLAEANRVMERKASTAATGAVEHREVRALRKIQEAEAAVTISDLGGQGPDAASDRVEDEALTALIEHSARVRTRSRSSSATRMVRICLACGSRKHRTDTCTSRTAEVVERWAQMKLWKGARNRHSRKEKLIARLKYSPIHQRLQDDRPAKRARTSQGMTGYEISQLAPHDSVLYHKSVGLLEELRGVACPSAACKEAVSKGDPGNHTLGELRKGRRRHKDISLKSVYHVCNACSKACSVRLNNPVYPGGVRGTIAVNKATRAFWNCVHGASETFTALDLGVGEKKVQEWCRLVRTITAMDTPSNY